MRDPISTGFGLLEALLALTIVSAVVLAALGAAAADLRAAAAEARALEASMLAEYQMARVRLGETPERSASGRFPEPFEAYAWRVDSRPTGDGRFVDVWITISSHTEDLALERRFAAPTARRR